MKQLGMIKKQIAPETLAFNFIEELRKQTDGKISKDQLERIIMEGLSEAKGKVITKLFDQGIDVDLTSQAINPDEESI